jgi:hypothetical protein
VNSVLLLSLQLLHGLPSRRIPRGFPRKIIINITTLITLDDVDDDDDLYRMFQKELHSFESLCKLWCGLAVRVPDYRPEVWVLFLALPDSLRSR